MTITQAAKSTAGKTTRRGWAWCKRRVRTRPSRQVTARVLIGASVVAFVGGLFAAPGAAHRVSAVHLAVACAAAAAALFLVTAPTHNGRWTADVGFLAAVGAGVWFLLPWLGAFGAVAADWVLGPILVFVIVGVLVLKALYAAKNKMFRFVKGKPPK